MKERYEHGKKLAHDFHESNLVALNAKDITIHQKSPKLGVRQLGPFKVLKCIGDLDYKLELPDWLKINPVLHVDRLSPWRDNGLKKPPPPRPDVINGEEEYEIDRILDSHIYCNQLQYLVKWKGYGQGKDSWLVAKSMPHAKKLITQFHKENPDAPCASQM